MVLPFKFHGCDTKSILCSLVCRSGIVCCTCFSLTSVSCSVMWFWSRSSILCVGPTWPPCRPYLRPSRALKRRSADRWGAGLKQYSYRPALKITEVCQSHKPVYWFTVQPKTWSEDDGIIFCVMNRSYDLPGRGMLCDGRRFALYFT